MKDASGAGMNFANSDNIEYAISEEIFCHLPTRKEARKMSDKALEEWIELFIVAAVSRFEDRLNNELGDVDEVREILE